MSTCWELFIIMPLLLSWSTTKAKAAAASNSSMMSKAKRGCDVATCGGVAVPYPFGIGDHCAMNEFFNLTCNYSHSPPELIFGENIQVLNISLENGTITGGILTAKRRYDSFGNFTSRNVYINLGDGLFRFSHTRNKFIGYGCDTVAYMTNADSRFWGGCVSMCTKESISPTSKTEKSCSGIGCCQTPLPKSLTKLNITLDSFYNHTNLNGSMPNDFAFFADETFDLPDLGICNSEGQDDEFRTSKATIEWVVKEENCSDTNRNSSDYVCGPNSHCTYSDNGQGYRCLCDDGFHGNPYQGCEDINECNDPKQYKCEGTCHNTIGNYTCKCPLGMHGDGKVGCRGFQITTIVAVIGAAIFNVIIGVLIFIACQQQRRERNFLRNGGVLLKSQRVRIFTEAELAKATKNYDSSQFLGEGGFGSVYKGVLPDNTQVAVKKPKVADKIRITEEFQHEIRIVSQMNHKNVVKILGLCLQTKVPLLVYEFVSNGTLSHHIHNKSSLVLRTWRNCLRIAAETALALNYFHSLASPPIIHGDVKSANILLDDEYTVKVADFGASVLMSPDQTAMAKNIQGTFGYLDPEYLMTGNLTEKSDVYSFGVVLVELLTGVKPGSRMITSKEKINIIQYFLSSIENNTLLDILCFKFDQDEKEEIEIVAELAMKCLNSSGIKRPRIKDVSDELGKLKELHENLWAQKNSEETEHLLGESSNYIINEHPMGSAIFKPPAETHTAISFDIENYSYSM